MDSLLFAALLVVLLAFAGGITSPQRGRRIR